MMRRRGVGLLIALVAIVMVGATASLLVFHVGHLARREKQDRVCSYAQVVLDSGLAYARAHQQHLRTSTQPGELDLPTDGLVPGPAKARLTVKTEKGGRVRVRATVELGRSHATEEVVLPAESDGKVVPTRPAATQSSPVTPSSAPQAARNKD